MNQILSKLDGVNAIPNVLLIGMTNRRELLDEALLRLEVQVEIPLPNEEGRREILGIHFKVLRCQRRLSTILCRAVDGADDDDTPVTTTTGRKRDAVRRAVRRMVNTAGGAGSYDLAADPVTGGFSGAELAGLVTLEDVKEALVEVRG